MNIHTVLFDLDGTLIDTNELIIASFLHTFEQYGKKLSRKEAIDFIGPPLRDSFEQVDPEQAESMMASYREHNLQHHDDYVTAFPNVIETLERLKKNNIQLGIVTTKISSTVDMGLNVTGLGNYFKTIITMDDVTNAKPHPEPIEKAMKALQANPDSTLMVGDNQHDIDAGKNAGIQTAGVAWSLKGRARISELNPTYMLDDMRDLLSIVGV